jgi:hypothetical protein
MSTARLTRKLESIALAVGSEPAVRASGDPRTALIEVERLEEARRNAILVLLDSANPDDHARNRQLFDAKVNLGHVRRSVLERNARMSTPTG